MTTMEWNNGMGHRGRLPWLLLVKDGIVTPFAGVTIPELVVVRGTSFSKNGKWSATTYRLEIGQGVRAMAGKDGWETGRFSEGLAALTHRPVDTWGDVAAALGVSVPSAMAFLAAWRPRAALALTAVDDAIAALDDANDLDDADGAIEIVTVDFGSPSNREIRGGYWEAPKSLPGGTGRIELIATDYASGGWGEPANLRLVGVEGRILSATHSRGMHGGYYAVRVAVYRGNATD